MSNPAQSKEGAHADGLSAYTHRVARTKPRAQVRSITLRERIVQQEHAFRELKKRFDRASETERPYLQKQLGIKAAWLETLWQSLAEQKRNA